MFGRITQHWPLWLLATVSYPLAGIAGRLLAGPATTWTAALLAGVVAGLVVGGAQALAMSPRRPDLRWPLAMAVGSGIGLAASVAMGLSPLATGLLTGALIGIAQAAVASRAMLDARRSVLAWPVVVALAWGLGWTVTTAIGVDPEAGWAVFGLSGALTSQVVTLAGAFGLVRTSSTAIA
jgi:hypothetical protein